MASKKINCRLKRNKGSPKCERKWSQVRDNRQETVWVNPGKNRRVVVAKGDHMWSAWREKNEGRFFSDDAHINNGFIGKSRSNKKDVVSRAKKYMRDNK